MLSFAQSELENYLSKMGITKYDITLRLTREQSEDDHIRAEITNGRGYIAGSNARSVLMGVYMALNRWGCRFLRPGENGEFIPDTPPRQLDAYLDEKPSFRYRGVCIEGAVSFENALAFIDWLPKVYFNTFFIQFETPFTFFDRWYSHLNNELAKPAPKTLAEIQDFSKILRGEIKKRGIMLHDVGHGFAGASVGIEAFDFDTHDEIRASEENLPYLAMLSGTRGIFKNRPIYTNLCYSNPCAREQIVRYIVRYMEENPDVDVLQFWLSDGTNAYCECEGCTDLPSDYYVQMMNELDLVLTKKGDGRKIVFLMYQDTYWAPEKHKINNLDRYALMYAPINRKYTDGILPKQLSDGTQVYVKNKNKLPTDMPANLPYLKKWQSVFEGECLLFDYHLMWFGYSDIAGEGVARILHEDLKQLDSLGLNGLISCQSLRSFFPSGWAMYVMANTLWNKEVDYHALKQDFFLHAFGGEGAACAGCLSEISKLSHIEFISCESHTLTPDMKRDFEKIPAVHARLQALYEKNKNSANKTHWQSWDYIGAFLGLSALIAEYLLCTARGQAAETFRLWEEMKTYIWQNEGRIQPVMDIYEFIYAPKFCRNIFGNYDRVITERPTI